MNLMQGDTYVFPVAVNICGVPVTDKDVKRIEFIFGRVVKHYPEDVSYKDGKFLISLSQEDTFSLAGKVKYQTRVLFADGRVKSSPVCEGNVLISLSKQVLT